MVYVLFIFLYKISLIDLLVFFCLEGNAAVSTIEAIKHTAQAAGKREKTNKSIKEML